MERNIFQRTGEAREYHRAFVDRLNATKNVIEVRLLQLEIKGWRHAPFVREHLKAGKPVVGLLTHQSHADFLVALNAVNSFSAGLIRSVGYPASSKLYPGGELYKTEGVRREAIGEKLGIHFFKMIQHYLNDGDMAMQSVNARALVGMRKLLEKDRTYVGYFVEGGRHKENEVADGIMRKAQDGVELLFARHPRKEKELSENDRVLGIPISLEDTRFLLKENGKPNYRMLIHPFPVNFGQPFFARDIVNDMKIFGHSFSDTIGARIGSLVPRDLRGFYADERFSELVAHSEVRNQYEYGTWP